MFSPKARNQPQPAKPARYSRSWRHSPLQGSLLKQTRCDCLSQPIIGLLPPHVHGMLLVMKVLNAPQGPHMGLAIKPSPVSLSVPVVRAVTCCLFPFRSCRAPLSSLCVQKHHPSPLSSRRRYAMHPRCLHVAAVCRRSSLLFSSVVASFLPPSLPPRTFGNNCFLGSWSVICTLWPFSLPEAELWWREGSWAGRQLQRVPLCESCEAAQGLSPREFSSSYQEAEMGKDLTPCPMLPAASSEMLFLLGLLEGLLCAKA